MHFSVRERLIKDIILGHSFMIFSSGNNVYHRLKEVYLHWMRMEILDEKRLTIFILYEICHNCQNININNIFNFGYDISWGTFRPHKFTQRNFSFDTQRNKKRIVILRCLLTYYTAQQIHKQANATLLLSKFLKNNWS